MGKPLISRKKAPFLIFLTGTAIAICLFLVFSNENNPLFGDNAAKNSSENGHSRGFSVRSIFSRRDQTAIHGENSALGEGENKDGENPEMDEESIFLTEEELAAQAEIQALIAAQSGGAQEADAESAAQNSSQVQNQSGIQETANAQAGTLGIQGIGSAQPGTQGTESAQLGTQGSADGQTGGNPFLAHGPGAESGSLAEDHFTHENIIYDAFGNIIGGTALSYGSLNEHNILDIEHHLMVEEIPEIPPPPPPPPYVIPEHMILITRGAYVMGSPEEEADRLEDEIQHWVTVGAFYISKYEVTQREYEQIMGNNPSYSKDPSLPVENVSWFDAVEYCNRLSIREGLNPVYTITGAGLYQVVTWDHEANGYRLPIEAEWEYACRAGSTTTFNTGNSISRSRANYFGRGTTRVGSYPPNEWGLYDMHGNVSEWCWDWYEDYTLMTATSHTSAFSQLHRIFRGGNWLNTVMRLRSAFRDHFYPTHRSIGIGFRVALNHE